MQLKGQMFVITMVFLVTMMFTVQTLLIQYSEIDISGPSRKSDSYVVDNIESVFQSALDSSDACSEARDNVKILRHDISGQIKLGREISVTGDINCTPLGDWSPQPDLTLNVLIKGQGGETFTTLYLNRGVPSLPPVPCTDCASCSALIQSSSPGSTIILEANISNHAGNCIDFDGTDQVTFDCNGHYIDGDGSGSDIGIWLTGTGVGGSSNNLVRNCPAVQDFEIGIAISTGSDFNRIQNSNISHNDYGVVIHHSSNSQIYDLILSHNEYALEIRGDSSGNSIARSNIFNNSEAGLYLHDDAGIQPINNVIADNMISNSGNYGNVRLGPGVPSNDFYTSLSCSPGSGQNIIGGDCLGGNFWSDMGGYGYSDNCLDSDFNGICDDPYVLDAVNQDLFPLTSPTSPEIYHLSTCEDFNENVLDAPFGSTFILDNDVYGIPDRCFNFSGADWKTLDCQGHIIQGSTKTGIWLQGTGVGGSRNNIIKNCIIEGFASCMTISHDSDRNHIINTTFQSCSNGINFYTNYGNVIENSTIINNFRGVNFNNAAVENNITRTYFEGNTAYHIMFRDSGTGYLPADNNIYDNIFVDNNPADYVEADPGVPMNYFNILADCSHENIQGGPCIGGNVWTNSGSTGPSDTCTDSDSDGFCDNPYPLPEGMSDDLPIKV